MMYASAAGTSAMAESLPIATAPLTATDRSGSANGASPWLTRSTMARSRSTPTTSSPPVAKQTAVGKPM